MHYLIVYYSQFISGATRFLIFTTAERSLENALLHGRSFKEPNAEVSVAGQYMFAILGSLEGI